MDKEYIRRNVAAFLYLFRLQERGTTNMLGAAPYLQASQGLDKSEAREILMYWCENYDEIAKELSVAV
jgi:hypothetical protein